MITPRQVSPSVQSLFAPQPERLLSSPGRKSTTASIAEADLLAGKRASATLKTKRSERVTARNNGGEGASDSFGDQLEKAVKQQSSTDRDRTTDERRTTDDAPQADKPTQGERAKHRSSDRTESKRSEGEAFEAESTRDGADDRSGRSADGDGLTAVGEGGLRSVVADAALAESAEGLTAGDADSAVGDETLHNTRGGVANTLSFADDSAQSSGEKLAGQSPVGVSSGQGGIAIDGVVLKGVKPAEATLTTVSLSKSAEVADHADGASALTVGGDLRALGGDSADASTPLGATTNSGVQPEREQGTAEDQRTDSQRLLDARAELVSRTSRLAVLKAQPLTIDSLNELLVTIDPSLARQILRPTSLNGSVAVLENVQSRADMVNIERSERGEFTPPSDGAIEQPENDVEVFTKFSARASENVKQVELAVVSERGSIVMRSETGSSDREGSNKPLIDQRREDVVRERVVLDTQRPTVTGSAAAFGLNASNAAKASVGMIHDATRSDTAAGVPGESTLKSQAVTGAASAANGSSGSTTDQGSGGDRGSTLLQTGGGSALYTEDGEVDRALTAAVASQLTRGVSSALRQRVGSMVMKLQPESLGQVRVNIDFASTTLNVRFDTASAHASEAIRSAMSELNASLASRGYTLGEARVSIDPTLSIPGRGGEQTTFTQAAGILVESGIGPSMQKTAARGSAASARDEKAEKSAESSRGDAAGLDDADAVTVDSRGEVVRRKLSAVG